MNNDIRSIVYSLCGALNDRYEPSVWETERMGNIVNAIMMGMLPDDGQTPFFETDTELSVYLNARCAGRKLREDIVAEHPALAGKI